MSNTINIIQSVESVCTTSMYIYGSLSRNESVFYLFDVTYLFQKAYQPICIRIRKKRHKPGKMMETEVNTHSVVLNSTEDCPVCLDTIQEKKTLKCLHSFCSDCIDSVFKLKPACPICNTYHGVYTGTQPPGTMTVTSSWQCLPGFEHSGSITILYSFPAGVQGVRLTAFTPIKAIYCTFYSFSRS